MKRYQILVVDDDPKIFELLCAILKDDYELAHAADGLEALERLEILRPHLIILDLKMPKQDGIETCRKLRANIQTMDIPILVISGFNDVANRVRSFEVGADDFLGKPFRPEELRSRIRSKIMRFYERPEGASQTKDLGEISLGNIKLIPDQMHVLLNGEKIHLHLTEYEILKVLLMNQGRVMSRDSILKQAWRGVNVSTRTIDAHIVSLRKKLKGISHPIETIYGVGYAIYSGGTPSKAALSPSIPV